MRLLLDEMYPASLAAGLEADGIDTVTVFAQHLAGAPDDEVFAAARLDHRSVLTENVADFVQLAAQCVIAGDHHAGLLIALSSRFSRRPAGLRRLHTALHAVTADDLVDRVVYLREPAQR